MTSETATIKATLKRRLKYQHHVYCLNVRPELVHQAADFLKTTPLYKAHNVTINSEWTYSGNVDISSEEMTETDHEQVDIEDGNTNNNDVADGALQDNDGTNKASEPSKVNEQDGNNESYDSDEDDKWSEVDENELMSGQADTLLTAPDFVEPAERQLIYNFAPGEGQIPVSVFMEENAEELAFPGIFCGTKRPSNKDRSVNVSYGEIVKAELRNVDRRAAGSIENIFFKTKKIQMKTLLDQTQLALRKVNLKDKKLTVKDVRGTAAIDLIHHDKAYKFLTKIRGSPPYFEQFCEDSDDDVCAYIDRFITCRLPDESESELFDLVSLQSHKHTKTCRKKGKKTCRFGFPKPPLKKTTILHPLEPPNFSKDEIARHKSVWISIKKELDNIGDDENTTICLLLDKLELTYEKYILAIRASIKSSTVFLKRSPQEVRVNNYNTNILKGWRANLDVQFVLDVFACATYVASYITKSQRGMSELLRKASDEARKGNQTLTEQIKTVGNHFLNAVEIGAQEAAYICLQLPMKKSSRQTIFLNTSPPEERVSLLKPSTLLDKMEDEDDDIECGNIFSRYCDRPRTMENMTLTEYAAYYDDSPGRLEFRRNTKGSKTKTVLPEPNIEKNDDEVENEEIDVSKDSRQYRKRKKARIIRSVHFDIKTDSEKYYRELLVLYSSWRNENDLKKSCNSFNERYLEIKDEVETERELYEPFREIVEDAQQIINQGVEDSWDEIAPQTEMQNAMDKDNRTDPKDTGIENYDIGIDLGLQPSNQEQELNRDFELPDQEFRCHLRKLNKEQLEFVYDAIHILKTSEEPIYWFLSGGAGVGKSYVTKALYQMAVKFYSKQAGEDFSSNKVMLLAPTGKAAYHIHGNTIHSALKVPVNQKLQYKQLSSAALNTLRNQIGEVNLIFIDEISMVGFNMLNFIHQRLMEVTQKNELFGGISVIAVGDLFQLKPVMDSYLFTSPTTGYMPLATNIWKENFTMFELHEIMRQSENKPFAELLNRLREGNHNKQDISVLKERNINENTEDYPWDVPHLFCTNEKVDSFNSAIIYRKNDLVYVIRAQDKFIGSAPPGLKAKILDSFGNNKQNSKQLLNSLEVAENTYYEITANLDTTDGLINGASCKMMKVEINQISEYASGILWVQFEDQNIGKQHRRENRLSKSFPAGNKGEAQIQRSQFPIRPAHAKTVHRSQGDTLSKVVVDLTSKRRVDHIHYVAVSRVQTLDGLFIRNLQEDKIGVDKNVKTEMERLRATTIERRLRNIYDLENSLLKICFLNASSLHRHLEHVRLDRNITNADIACFCETRFHNRDSVDATQIDAFHQYRQDSKPSGHKRPPYGLAIYSKEPFCPSFPINESSNGIELSVFRTNHNSDITIVTVYKPPHKPISELCERLLHVHETYVCNNDAIILGDLNVNWKEDSSNKQKLLTLMQQLKYKQLITQPTNDYGSTIDLIFTNIDCVDSGTNEVFFSDHKLTWLSLLSA
ncbi:Hypothetical predicted protein [Mytilus galloprovincialis]|uniref:ATP-dependent DNA helicase n=1 Tax=Mytilus galloprovincialis TaxID=29158 RepID=A0A8B6FWG2_MYTGA|nr:Hypothetical predicted protein [Mytilus galloprovincialis]